MIYTVAQQKGGVGKTTTAINVAALLGRQGRRVLAVDVDPQFALTRQVGIDVRELPVTLVDVLAGRVGAGDVVVHDVHGIDVVPAARELSGVELALVGEVGRETFLSEALAPLGDDYDDVVIDTPPNLGLLTVNALMPADVVLAPVSAEDEGSAQGVAELRATLTKLERLRHGDQPRLVVVLTKWTAGRVMGEVIEQAVAGLGLDIAARIPARVAVQQAAARRLPLALAAPDSRPGIEYERLAHTLVASEAA